jgi:hypothetical protein
MNELLRLKNYSVNAYSDLLCDQFELLGYFVGKGSIEVGLMHTCDHVMRLCYKHS